MQTTLRVLVVDDERINCRTTVQQLEGAGYVADGVENAFQALDRLDEQPWDVILCDLRMPSMDGLEFLRRAKSTHPQVSVIIMTAYGNVDTAVEAMRVGAADFLTKPFPFNALDVRLEKLRELCEARREISSLRALIGNSQAVVTFGLVGRSAAMQKVFERLAAFAKASAPVLVVGETGTGKEMIARALHMEGPRRSGPFVEVACAAIPRDLAESELLGHEKGAFTGATESRRGCFERAHGGTLLLDDVDDLPSELQGKLLRVLQEGRFARVGGTNEITVDVRVVATTKADLSVPEVRANKFRDDLFFRLCGLTVHLPPLRDRGEDVLLLATHFLGVLTASERLPPKRLIPETADLLRSHAWPGNVRELRRALESAVVLCAGDEITPACLPESLRRPREAKGARLFDLRLDQVSSVDLQELVGRIEDVLLDWALRKSGGNQHRAAELLGLPRSTFQSKLKRSR